VVNDAGSGVISANLNFAGSVFAVVSASTGWLQTLNSDTPEYSSFDPNTSAAFGSREQFSYLQIAEPQIGSRLLVLDPATHNYAYVEASAVGPSGPRA